MMLDAEEIFEIREFDSWKDVGNIGGLLKARSEYERKLLTLEKNNEEIYRIENTVIKYFADPEICSKRVQRSRLLTSAVPKMITTKSHYYKYEFVDGNPVSEILDEAIFGELLTWGDKNIWSKDSKKFPESFFRQKCQEFYFDKTRLRINEFFKKTGNHDSRQQINGLETPSIQELLRLLEKEKLDEGYQSLIHGDFILDNILKTRDSFISLDWRQDFSGLIETGDLYYDFAKLNHSLTMNHKMLVEGMYSLGYDNDGITVQVNLSQESKKCSLAFFEYIRRLNLSARKVQILTSLIWINMSALHPHPLDNFLFYYGKHSLWNTLKGVSHE